MTITQVVTRAVVIGIGAYIFKWVIINELLNSEELIVPSNNYLIQIKKIILNAKWYK